LAGFPKMVFVLSAKGGVGKSTVAAALSLWLARIFEGRVGLLDCDVTNPSIPHIMNVEAEFKPSPDLLQPVEAGGVKTASVVYALPGRGLPIVWRGETAKSFVYQMLKSLNWQVEVLVMDTPPGVHDETLWLLKSFSRAGGAIVVTTPQELAVENVRRTISFCRDQKIPVIGLVENMSYIGCPECGHKQPLGGGDAEVMAAEENVPYCGSIPFLPQLQRARDLDVMMEQEAFKKLATYTLAYVKGVEEK